jgi:predicted nucleic acid-binding protein
VRVVFDTNIYISALAIPGGNAEDAYLEAIRGTFELFTSVAILTETARVLQTKFDWSEDKPSSSSQEIAISWRSSTMQTSP